MMQPSGSTSAAVDASSGALILIAFTAGMLANHLNQIGVNRIDCLVGAQPLRELPLALIRIADKQQSRVS